MAATKITIDGTDYELKAIPNKASHSSGIVDEMKDWRKNRLNVINEAIKRSLNLGKFIPTDWIAERETLLGWLQESEIHPSIPQRTKLFTTIDGKDVFEGDKYWLVSSGDLTVAIGDLNYLTQMKFETLKIIAK